MSPSLETHTGQLRDRERQVSRTFVELADTLVADFLTMLVEQCVGLLGVSAASVILLDQDGSLHVAATSTQRAELLELFAVQTEEGPCIGCARTGVPVLCADLQAESQRWPTFTAAAHECGYHAAQALPMRLREQVIGVLTLLDAEPGGPAPDTLELGQAFADIATIGILQQRTIEQGDRLSGQLQTALNSRVAIEQAKGVLAERGGISMDEAFIRLRAYVRTHHQRLTDVSRAVTEGTADLTAILAQRQH
ncbi:GAF and ANTAR domain-containing protein [Amycolatopsis saalfeldensis]|uniref:GAF domain-containing protein n=1 Tax=Amycolatopsis saalfeldensis TaxID=394193 RepID=A0A1H8YJK4_9PSEU|nr:GAF and ANTAR domain-containing protein [Amycolatopsis saalfeldensis]SEP52350.1 GAF domain-containing protein [Amycolatopsis saalfeldensis]